MRDTNHLQAALLLAMKPDGQGLTVVGDDAQSIYRFRGATVRNILDFPEHFAPAAVITLDQNYRSTQPILAAANDVIALAKERYSKDLWSERTSEQKPQLIAVRDGVWNRATYVDRQILARRESGQTQVYKAVLFRSSTHQRTAGNRTHAAQHPVRKIRRPQVSRSPAHQGCAGDPLRWTQNPRDRVSGFRAIQLLPGIGPKTAQPASSKTCSQHHPVAPCWKSNRSRKTFITTGEFVALVDKLGIAGLADTDGKVSQWYETPDGPAV